MKQNKISPSNTIAITLLSQASHRSFLLERIGFTGVSWNTFLILSLKGKTVISSKVNIIIKLCFKVPT